MKSIAVFTMVIILVSILTLVFSSNALVSADEECNHELSNIDIAIQRKSNVLSEFVQSLKGEMQHEEQIFNKIAEARKVVNEAAGSNNPNALASADDVLTTETLNLLNIVHEDYPELASSKNFTKFNDSIEGSNNRIAQSRRAYNESVMNYNKLIRKFPTSIIADMKGMRSRPYFEKEISADSEISDKVDIDFNN